MSKNKILHSMQFLRVFTLGSIWNIQSLKKNNKMHYLQLTLRLYNIYNVYYIMFFPHFYYFLFNNTFP